MDNIAPRNGQNYGKDRNEPNNHQRKARIKQQLN